MWIPGVVGLAVVVLHHLVFSLCSVGCRNSIVASRNWAKESWVIANAQCVCMLLILISMLVEAVVCPAWVVLRVAVGALDSLVLLVDGWNAFLDPIHVICCCLCGVFPEVLVDGELAVAKAKLSQKDSSCGLEL